MGLIEEAIRVARKYYDNETYYHVMRVAAFITEDNLIPPENLENCVALAIMHDLIEDTNFNYYNDFDTSLYSCYMDDCLKLLTKSSNGTYEEYIHDIKNAYKNYPEVYWVKLADMKDHLTQTGTLTDELKEKYLKALPYLL